MTLNDAYLLSQIAAAMLVAPTLVYLALQVRQNTAQLRAVARYQFVEASGQMNTLTAGNPQMASLFRRGIANLDALNEDERMQFTVFVGHFLQIYSVMFELHKDRLLPDSQWYNIRMDLASLLGSPGGRRVFETFGRTGLDPAFIAMLDALTKDVAAPYDISKF